MLNECQITTGITSQREYKSVSSLINSAVNMTLPAFAAERRATAPLLLRQPAPTAVNRYVLPAGRSEANPPQATAAVLSNDGTDRPRDGRPTVTDILPDASYAGSISKGQQRRTVITRITTFGKSHLSKFCTK